jgi:hypothetical protein
MMLSAIINYNNSIISVRRSAPPSLAAPRIGEGARARALPLCSSTINIALPPSAPPSALCVLFHLSVACLLFLVSSLGLIHALLDPFPPRVPRPSFEPFGLAVARAGAARAQVGFEARILDLPLWSPMLTSVCDRDHFL